LIHVYLQFAYIIVVAAMMIARTYCDLWMITNGTSIERSIISRNAGDFRKYLSYFVAAMLPVRSSKRLQHSCTQAFISHSHHHL